MKQSQRGFVAYVVLITLGVLLMGGGFYYYSKNIGGFSVQEQEAKLKLEEEKTKLAEMKARYEKERAIIARIEQEYANVGLNIFSKTDSFFYDSETDNPKIKFKITDKNIEKDINNRRAQIAKMLEAWKKKIAAINSITDFQSLSLTLADLVKGAEKDMAYIQQYVRELENIISKLSTKDSNLTQAEINSYTSIIKIVSEQIQTSIAVVDNIQIEITPPVTQIPATIPPIVTPAQIQEQEKVVIEAQIVVDTPPVVSAPVTPPVTSPVTPVVPLSYPTRYLPSSDIDYSDWLDLKPKENPGKPIFIEGLNKI